VEDEVSGVWGRNEIEHFGGDTEGKDLWEDVGLDGMIILKCIFKK